MYLTVITLAFDENDRYAGITGNADVDWDREAYEYVAAVNWRRGHDPLVLVQNRRQTRDQVLEVAVAADGAALGARVCLRSTRTSSGSTWFTARPPTRRMVVWCARSTIWPRTPTV